MVSNNFFDVRIKSLLKDQGKYFVGGIQLGNTAVVVVVQSVSSCVWGR